LFYWCEWWTITWGFEPSGVISPQKWLLQETRGPIVCLRHLLFRPRS
jgi:hypothetical protein